MPLLPSLPSFRCSSFFLIVDHADGRNSPIFLIAGQNKKSKEKKADKPKLRLLWWFFLFFFLFSIAMNVLVLSRATGDTPNLKLRKQFLRQKIIEIFKII